MKISLLSKTETGKWAGSLCLLFIVLIALKTNIGFPLPTFFIAGLGIAGFIIGIISMFKNKDRSLITILSVLVGLIIVLWIAAEIAFPH